MVKKTFQSITTFFITYSIFMFAVALSWADVNSKSLSIVVRTKSLKDFNLEDSVVKHTCDIISAAGIECLSSSSKRKNILNIKLEGKSISKKYWAFGKSHNLYTGAEVFGTLTFAGDVESKRDFEGIKSPTDGFSLGGRTLMDEVTDITDKQIEERSRQRGNDIVEQYRLPGPDLFLSALGNGSFDTQITNLLVEIYGVEVLPKMLESEEVHIREAAIKALGQGKDQAGLERIIHGILNPRDVEEGYMMIDAFGERGADAAVLLLDKMEQQNLFFEDKYRSQIINKFSAMNESIVDLLRDKLKSKSDDIRGLCAAILKEMKSEKAILDLLHCCVSDEVERIRESCAWALSGIGEPAFIPMIDYLRTEKENSEALNRVAGRLIDIGPVNLDALSKLYLDQDVKNRTMAVNILFQWIDAFGVSWCDEAKVLKIIIQMLDDSDEQLRAYIIKSLDYNFKVEFNGSMEKWQAWWNEKYIKCREK